MPAERSYAIPAVSTRFPCAVRCGLVGCGGMRCDSRDGTPPVDAVAMLAPIERDGRVDGWISVHEARRPRHWTPEEQDAVLNAAEQVLRALG